MCLILLAVDSHPDYELILAGNRDEYYHRPTAPSGFWPGTTGLLAGRDLSGGGTWFGVTRTGRWATVSNVRDQIPPPPSARSRGLLVTDFLAGNDRPADFLEKTAEQKSSYAGFNLLVGEGTEAGYYSNREDFNRALKPGLYAVSNHLLDTPWPKVTSTKEGFRRVLSRPRFSPEDLFRIMADTEPATDDRLPDTGIGRERERLLSPPFVLAPVYGTRSTTLFLLDRGGRAAWFERRFKGAPGHWRESRYRFLRSG